jgi:hypothetical protein
MYRPCPQNPKPWGCTYRLVDGANGSIALRVNRGMPFPKSFILRTLEPYLTSNFCIHLRDTVVNALEKQLFVSFGL